MRWIAALIALIAGPAIADTALVFNTIGPNISGPNPVVLMMPMHMDVDHNVLMLATAVDPAGITSLTIIGNGRTLTMCQGSTCRFLWLRTAMRSGQNTVILRAVNGAGVTRDAPGYVNKPVAP